MELLLDALHSRADRTAQVQRLWARTMTDVDASIVLSDYGLPSRAAFVSELVDRLQRKWLPASPDTSDGGELFSQLFFHDKDPQWIEALPQQSKMFGFPQVEAFTPDRWLDDGDTVQVGHETLTVRHCPGHTPGHVVFHSASAQRVFVGDVLFAGSIGRTDFPGGNHQQLLDAIRTRLWPMGDDTVFIPGHGPESTFGRERRTNPYVGGT